MVCFCGGGGVFMEGGRCGAGRGARPADTDCIFLIIIVKKRAKIRNRYNQAPHLTQDTNVKLTTSQLDITNESQGSALSQQVTIRHQ